MYKVSVVTPFHNVDMGMFQKCAESMRAQTLGFENIEWIIVVHNCKPHYLPLLTEMFKDDRNVIIKELNDDFHSPASPRNHGMKFVTGPYLGFLDGDDSYTPDCLEVVRREMIETGSQVVTFRREYELETESLHPHTEMVAWNQTEWRIVMDRKDFQMDKMFIGLWPFSTSRLFDVSFLRKHDLYFSKDVFWVDIADMFDYMTTHRDELTEELRRIDAQRADEVERAFHSEQPLAKALWPNLERIVAFGAGEYYDATAHMKHFTGQIPHNNGYYYTEETIYGRAIADDSDLFETLPSKSFHEYQPLNDSDMATLLSTDTKPGVPYQLVVTNNAGLYRYVTDHIVCIQEKQIDRILFTIY